jgi:shikimate dehydrogenase
VGTGDEAWDLLVNATPVGMQPQSDATPLEARRLRPEGWVFDAVYRPLETRLLAEAKARGCRTLDGLGMLVHQASEQVRLWSGRAPSFDRLRAAAERAL